MRRGHWLAKSPPLAKTANIPVCSHGMQELHVSLVAGQVNQGWLEIYSFDIENYTMQPVQIENQLAHAPDVPGIGVTFDWDKLAKACA